MFISMERLRLTVVLTKGDTHVRTDELVGTMRDAQLFAMGAAESVGADGYSISETDSGEVLETGVTHA
jgi:hypothetical protein